MIAKLTAAIIVCIIPLLTAQWSNDPGVNTIVCNYSGDQLINGLVTDGSGGAIIAWWDKRDITGYQVPYAQRISADGIQLWNPEGVKLYDGALTFMDNLKIIADNNGGAYVSYIVKEENSVASYDLWGAYINSNGNTVTFPVSSTKNISEQSPSLSLDMDGNAFIAYEVYFSNENTYDIYVQKVNVTGTRFWNADSTISGKPVVNVPGLQRYPHIAEDDSGGAFIVWEDLRNINTTLWDIYIQRINSEGTGLWPSGGIPVVEADHYQIFPRIAKTSYGAAVAWDDQRTGYTRLYAKGIDHSGNAVWGDNGGKMISDSVLLSESISIFSFGENNRKTDVVLSWAQNLFQSSFIDIYAQRIDSAGNVKWQDKGLLVCNADNMQWKSKITAINENGENKVVVVWEDERNSSTTGSDIYAQKISLNGSIEWLTNGIQVTSANNYQVNPLILPGANGFSIAAWTDGRIASFNGSDIYAQRLTPGGLVSVNDSHSEQLRDFVLFNNYPNPFNPSTNIEFIVSENTFVSLKVYDVLGNQVADLINKVVPAGKHKYQFDGSLMSSGLYLYKINAGNFSTTRKMLLVK